MKSSLADSFGARALRVWQIGVPLGILALGLIAARSSAQSTDALCNVILGRPTNDSVALNVLAATNVELFCDYATTPGAYTGETGLTNLTANVPGVLTLTGLQPDSRYYYRLRYRFTGQTNYSTGIEGTFHTQRTPGSAFCFSIQGDSHPERVNNMFESAHYTNTLSTAAADVPDFYVAMGDDFSVDLIPSNSINQALVAQRYAIQRPWLGIVGNSAPLFLVNGNHEQASLANYLSTNLVAAGVSSVTLSNLAVWAQNARSDYYPEPSADDFYSGMTNDVLSNIGPLRSAYAWTWGDALFVVLDPYWYSTHAVDNQYGADQHPTSNKWLITHGDIQYNWLKATLEQSSARHKFVFAHHVLGAGRGGIECAPYYEWGGRNADGTWGFSDQRPTWALPIHQLMATNQVTIFFQCHDHVFVRQQLDGVTYLTLPSPADPNYSLFNSSAYTNYIYKANNSGYVRVNVSASEVKVDYVRTYLPSEEGPGKTNGMVDYSFTVGGSNSPPAIQTVATTPAAPVAGHPTWVTASVTDDVAVASVILNYRTGVAASVTNVVFLETMATNSLKPWNGSGCDHLWTVSGGSFEQRGGANYGSGNTNGLEFKGGTTNLADSSITTSDPIDAVGFSGWVDFALRPTGLSGEAGWTFQLDSGSGFVTRLSELTGTGHDWQLYHYDLRPAELVNNLKMRFQFRAGYNTNRIDLDQIAVKVVTGGSSWTSVPMNLASNGLYAAPIPPQPSGAIVNYYITAANRAGRTANHPPPGPGGALSFVVTNSTVIPFDIMLGRATDNSIAVSLLPSADLQVYCQYGTQSGVYLNQSAVTNLSSGTPGVLTLGSLLPNTRYYYTLVYRRLSETNYSVGGEHTFFTQRGQAESFTFDIEADPHWKDPNASISPELWQVALDNILADQPDFLIDLGDTFMAEKLGVTNYAGIAQLCLEVRSNQFSRISHSVPVFLVNGNHEAELGWFNDGTGNNLAAWATQARQRYYPCPVAGDFYSGSTSRDAYYSFKWGAALFVVLDPFWFTTPKPGSPATPWGWTLGTNQYAWLQQTLSTNAAAFKFVFMHHLVGGTPDGVARGGTAFAPYFEWGGYNTNGTWGFAANRPGWVVPIQELLLSNHVAAVFHGHDHLFVKQDLDQNGDGIPELIYQECPQPSATNYDTTANAARYGYTNGVVQGNSGHLRVHVAPSQATVEYVRAYLPADEGPGKTNRMVSYRYVITAPESPPLCIIEVTNTPTGLLIGWSSVASRNYAVLYKSTLAAPAWTSIATNRSVGTPTRFTETNTTRLTQPQGFYRVIQMP
jgi:phosphodiesterase/alkaline phosphatase D-like protein